MSTKAQKIRLGIFMFLSAVTMVGTVAVLAGLKMWNPKDRYFVVFTESISGLEVGSTVKMNGVRVGQVEKITIGKDVESVRVALALNPGTPVPRDTSAVMTSIGITGLKFIELTGGTSSARRIPPNTPKSEIPEGKSVLESLTGKATDIAMKTEGLLNNLLRLTDENNREKINRLLENTDKLVVSLEQLATGNSDRIGRILVNTDRTTRSLSKTSGRIAQLADDAAQQLKSTLSAAESAAQGISRAAQSVQNITPQKTLSAITAAAESVRKRVADPSIEQALKALSGAATKISGLSSELNTAVRQRDRQLGAIMSNLDRASENLKQFSRTIKDRPSLLLRGETLKERDIP